MTFIFQLFNKRKLDYYPRYYYYEILLNKYRDGLFYSNLINNLKKTAKKLKLTYSDVG